jgi:hypothetical protein
VNHVSSEKNVNCGSNSPSTTDCRNQIQLGILLLTLLLLPLQSVVVAAAVVVVVVVVSRHRYSHSVLKGNLFPSVQISVVPLIRIYVSGLYIYFKMMACLQVMLNGSVVIWPTNHDMFVFLEPFRLPSLLCLMYLKVLP